jgi:hypothetical protein
MQALIDLYSVMNQLAEQLALAKTEVWISNCNGRPFLLPGMSACQCLMDGPSWCVHRCGLLLVLHPFYSGTCQASQLPLLRLKLLQGCRFGTGRPTTCPGDTLRKWQLLSGQYVLTSSICSSCHLHVAMFLCVSYPVRDCTVPCPPSGRPAVAREDLPTCHLSSQVDSAHVCIQRGHGCRRVARLLNTAIFTFEDGFDQQLREVLGPWYPPALMPTLAAACYAAIQACGLDQTVLCRSLLVNTAAVCGQHGVLPA